ncbi:phage tail protein [Tateyamaria sp.]|uniref:phage tail protein n=1 Tax=Tateyamaria sp. TaxID=1929288 RepID=UPI003B216095
MSKGNPALGHNFTITFSKSGSVGALITLSVGTPPEGGFAECSGLEVGIPAESYAEGGNNGTTLKFVGRPNWTNIKLRRGVVTSADLWRWHQDFIEGKGKRRDGVISLLDDQGETVRVWRFVRGLPVRWTGPTMHASQSQVAVEEIEIAHEGLRQTGAGSGSGVDTVANLFS